ncbi:MAG: hypothetical protein JWO36_6335 [Myxococcales bacterium]|nr:hypothetical protein [Myxococcales bacterium]
MDPTIDETRLAFERPLRFVTLDGRTFEVRSAELRVRGGESPRGQLRFRVDAAGYAQIIERSLFNLYPLVRDAGELARGDGDVEVIADLRPELLADLFSSDIEAEAIAEALVEHRREGLLGALCATESWLAVSIVEALDLPPELRGAGTLSTGYQTAWARGMLGATPAPAPARDEVRAMFARQGWHTEAIGDTLVRAAIEGEHGEWVFLVTTDEAAAVCTLSSIHPDDVPEARRAEIAAFLAARNRELDAGAFDIDPDDGELRLRSTILFGTEGLPPSLLERTALANLLAFDEHVDVLARLIRGEIDVAAASSQLS